MPVCQTSSTKFSSRSRSVALFLGLIVLSLCFAVATNHAWEDWYITWRASKNLALGNGLVFTVGERVHSFTSPLNTLIPALLSYLTGNRSDELVIWLYRIISCSLLGLSAVLLYRVARTTKMAAPATMLMLGLLAVDARIVDFSINGQEAAFMIFFMAAILYLMSCPAKGFTLKLGLAWGGLMWTRPDAFYYFGALAIGYLLFKPESPHFSTRWSMLKGFAGAALVCAAAYLPWLLWAGFYYGSPVPHTAIAKWLLVAPPYAGLFKKILFFPFQALFAFSSVTSTFAPPYFAFGGWPVSLIIASQILAVICAFYWCLPSGTPLGRAVSLALFLAHFCLTCLTPTFAPWYVPSVTFLSIFVLGQIVQQIFDRLNLLQGEGKDSPTWWLRRICPASLWLLFLLSLSQTLLIGYQFRIQQGVIETENRKSVGLWLKKNARTPNDTVFIESVGRVGYYSQLKMYDFPGLTSREVVAARRKLKTDEYGFLIQELQPDWLVLRPYEADRIDNQLPGMLTKRYQQVTVFDVSDKLTAYPFLPGRAYLQFDQTFIIFKKLTPQNASILPEQVHTSGDIFLRQ